METQYNDKVYEANITPINKQVKYFPPFSLSLSFYPLLLIPFLPFLLSQSFLAVSLPFALTVQPK